MLSSFTEFKQRKDSAKTVESVFSQLENEVAAIYVDPRKVNKIINLYSNWAESLVFGEKSLREYRIIREIPTAVKDVTLTCATDARKLVKKYKCQFIEDYTAFHPVDNAEVHIDKILNNMKDDLIKSFGVYPRQQQQQQQIQQPQQKPTWWDRLKRVAKDMWYGPGDPRMRQVAQAHGYSDYNTPQESVEPELNMLFEGIIKESIAELVGIIGKYKQELVNVVKQALHYHDALKSHYGSYRPSTPEAPSSQTAQTPEERPSDDEDEIRSDDRIPDIGDADMWDYPVKDVTPTTKQQPKPEPVTQPEKAPEQPAAAPEPVKEPEPIVSPKEPAKPVEQPVAKEKKARAKFKGKAYLTKVDDNGDLTFENKDGETVTVNYENVEKNANGVPKSVDIGGVPHAVLGTEFRKLASHLLPVQEPKPISKASKPEAEPEPEVPETDEEKQKKAQQAGDSGNVKLLDRSDIEKNFVVEKGEPHFKKGEKLLPIKAKVPHRSYYYIEAGKSWYMVSKKDWDKFAGAGKSDEAAPEETKSEPEKEDYSDLKLAATSKAVPKSNVDVDDEGMDDETFLKHAF